MPESNAESNIHSNHSSQNYDFFDDPLFLSSSDQPNLRLVDNIFDGSNFLSWKRDVSMALASKNKDGFIDGSCSMPEKTNKKYHQWIRCDLMVMKWILNSMDKTIKENLMYSNTSKELWSEILERYGQTNGLEIYQLKKEISNLTQENQPLIHYYNKLKRKWEDVDSLDPIPDCTCGALSLCTCQLLKRILDRESHSKLIQLLMGLNSGYENIKTTVLSMEPLPKINKALSLLQKIEMQKQITDALDVLTEANAYASSSGEANVHARERNWNRDDSSFAGASAKKCTHCFQKGHNREECFKLMECSYCEKKGHKREQCYKLYPEKNPRNTGKLPRKLNSGNNGYRKAANVDVLDYSEEESPIEDISISGNGNNQNQNPDMSIDSKLMNGLVSNVVQQVMKMLSEQGASCSNASTAINFAGPFK